MGCYEKKITKDLLKNNFFLGGGGGGRGSWTEMTKKNHCGINAFIITQLILSIHVVKTYIYI